MQVIFKNSWFTPNGRWRKSSQPQEVPDHLRNELPSTVVILDDASNEASFVPKEIVPKPELTLRDFDEDRPNSDAYSTLINETVALNDSYTSVSVVSAPAKALMDSMNINMDDVEGTGKDGRITLPDVHRYIDNRKE